MAFKRLTHAHSQCNRGPLDMILEMEGEKKTQ